MFVQRLVRRIRYFMFKSQYSDATGDIERFTIPKSQGKQAYSDARKSHWGDLFPHLAKNGNEKRPKRRGAKARDSKDGGLDALRGFDMLEDMDLDLD